jgi:hypothetical protein
VPVEQRIIYLREIRWICFSLYIITRKLARALQREIGEKSTFDEKVNAHNLRIFFPFHLNIYLFDLLPLTPQPPNHLLTTKRIYCEGQYTISYAHTPLSNRAGNMRLDSKLTRLGLFLEAT